jgi:hypothetical protein
VPASGRRLALWALALLVLAGHLPFLATTLEDLDSFNFSLGLHAFDPRLHQPHPPGYPVVIALGRVALPVVTALGVATGPAADARALALVSAIAGALTVLPLFVLYRRLDAVGVRGSDHAGRDGRALAAVVLAVVAPLAWFTMARPMSDVPGLLLALAAQALLAGAWMEQRAADPSGRATRHADRLLLWGALVAAAAVGARSQAVWLVAPIFGLALVARRGPGAGRARVSAAGVFALACLAWVVPLLRESGGLDGYLGTLADQAGEDFAGVEMVWTTPSLRMIAFALRYGFLDVWGPLPTGILVVVAAACGVTALVARGRHALLLAGVLWLPYFVFHLLFQETATSRYDLPLVPPMAWLATQGLLLLPRLALPLSVGAIAVASLAFTAPALARYAADGSPIARAMADLHAAGQAPTLAAHRVFLRAFQADAPLPTPISARHGREWLEVVRRWREGHDTSRAPGGLWFLAEPRRTDLALVDPVSRVERRRYDWTFDAPRFIRGTRPDAVAWHVVSPAPGWFLGEGWALTPELAGVAARQGAGLARGALRADVRRRPEEATLLIGGRHLGRATDAAVEFEVQIDGSRVDVWSAAPGAFLRVVGLPAGRLAGDGYAALAVRATPAAGTMLPPVAIEQFDLQSAGVPEWGFDVGWHEAEYDGRTGRPFRWTSASAALRVVNVSRDVELRLVGDSPLKYVYRAPIVVVRAGAATLAREEPSDAFDWHIRVPREALERAGGVVTLETDLPFRPADTGSADRRVLGLRLFEVAIAR